jgi:hypothetical protein
MYKAFKMKGPSLYRTSPLKEGAHHKEEGPKAPPTPAFYKESALKSACTPEGCPASGGGVTDSSKDPSKKTGGGEQKIKKQESIKRPERNPEKEEGPTGQESKGEEKEGKKEKTAEEKAAENQQRATSVASAGAELGK